jgi:surface antigen Omp85-like protein
MSLRFSALLPLAGILALAVWDASAADPAPPKPQAKPPSAAHSVKSDTTPLPPKSPAAPVAADTAKKADRPLTGSARADSLAAAGSIRAATDSILQAAGAQALQDSAQYKKLYEYIAYPMLQLATFPVELVLVPTVKLLIYPSKAPLRYMLNENVIDRTINLISYGEGDHVMIYPTINLAPGTGSYTGLTFRHQTIFGRPTESMVAQGNLYVNGDWKFRSYLNAKDIAGTGFSSKSAMSLVRVKNQSLNQPGTSSYWFYSDTSNIFSQSLGHRIVEEFSLRGTFVFRDNHFGHAPPQEDSLYSDFFRNAAGVLDTVSRGLNDSWQDRILALGVNRDTRNNENIPLAGSNFAATYHYHLTSAHHDFHGWEATLTNYFKLGKEKYEVYVPPGKKDGATGVRKVLRRMDLENLKNELFNRKALVTHLYSAQVYELEGNRMPVYGLQTLGNDTPMRGYGGSRFRDYTVLSAGAEYRFPIMRLVDGMMFNEYGINGRSWDKIDVLENVKNSWGFGIRVRRPDIYLFRLQLGFHGAQGIQVNMSVDEPY